MFVPGQYQGQRQFIHGASKGFCQRQGNPNGAVSVVALTHVQDAGNTVDFSEIQIVEPVFSAGQGEDNGVHGSALYKFGVVVPSGMSAVAAAHQKDVADFSAANGFGQMGGLIQYSFVSESGGEHMSAVDAAHTVVLGISP